MTDSPVPAGCTVANVRSAAGAMLRWCDDEFASPAVLGSILTPLLGSVAPPRSGLDIDGTLHGECS